VPRNRTAKLAVLGSAAQRSQNASYSRSSDPVKRRIVVGVLVVLSLALITVYFRESSGGVLHGTQSAASTVLRPFEVASERVARPFRDAYGYFSGLVHAKSKVKQLEQENARLRRLATLNATAYAENQNLRKMLHFQQSPRFPQDYVPVSTTVLSMPAQSFDRQIVIDAGRSNGVKQWSPVLDDGGALVGQVTEVASHTARVTLLTDQSSYVAARDARTPATTGLVQHSGQGDQLVLSRVQKNQVVREGDEVVTAGSLEGKLPSVYPEGIEIGRITGVSQNDIDIFKQIQVKPFADFSSLSAVTVIVPKTTPAGVP
jgi:rod shape-determining protein MreC